MSLQAPHIIAGALSAAMAEKQGTTDKESIKAFFPCTHVLLA